jgi:hypothetical protein
MMAAPRNPVEVRRALTQTEAVALAHVEASIKAGKPVTQLSVQEAIGSRNSTGSTGTQVLRRLERAGYIRRDSRNRAVKVCLVDTGECTPEPRDKSKWYDRLERVASPPAHAIRARQPTLMQWAEAFAKGINMPLTELLERACVCGLDMIREEQSRGEAA